MVKVKAVQSEGDWFVIPEEMEYLFDTLENQMIEDNYDNQEIVDIFESYFDKYRTGGDLNNIQLYAEI